MPTWAGSRGLRGAGSSKSFKVAKFGFHIISSHDSTKFIFSSRSFHNKVSVSLFDLDFYDKNK